MVLEDAKIVGVLKEPGTNIPRTYHIEDVLADPWMVLSLLASLSLLIGAAIRLTRASLAPGIESYARLESNRLKYCKRCCSLQGLCGWICFFRKLPRIIWNFYIESFLVPLYRKEWGRYAKWSYTSATVSQEPEDLLLQEQDRAQKRLDKLQKKADKIPKPIPHYHLDCERIRINVSGIRFETQLRTLERYPDTLLGNADKRLPYFNPRTREYYFDRCRATFEIILYYYQSGGRFVRPDNISADVLMDEARFFQLDKAILDKFEEDEGLSPQMNKHEILPQGLLRRKLWVLFDVPESSTQAGVVVFFSTLSLAISIAMLCVETITRFYLKAIYGIKEDGTVKVEYFDRLDVTDPFIFADDTCNIWFILEFLARLCCCPEFGRFISSGINIVDLLGILPFVVSTIIPVIGKIAGIGLEIEGELVDDDGMNSGDYLYLFRLIRIIRVFRIFKLSRQLKGLQILAKTVKASLNELLLLIFFIIIGMVMFSSSMYFAELDNPDTKFESIPGGFWWALITLTTVGYGDIVPISPMGKVVGALCAVTGVLVIALPVPVIVTNFNYFYRQSIDEQDLKWMNINFVHSCPFRPVGGKTETNQDAPDEDDQYSSDEEFGSLKKTNLNKK